MTGVQTCALPISNVVKNDLVYQIKKTYCNLQYLYAKQILLKKQDSIFEGFVKSAKARYKTGESTLLELSTAETQLYKNQNIYQENEANIKIYLIQLQALLGTTEVISIVDKQLTEQVFLESVSEKSTTNNPILAFLQQQTLIAERQKKLETAKALPEFTVGYFNQSLIGAPLNAFGADVATANNRFQGFHLGIAVPLFFSSFSGKIKAASINKEISKTNLEKTQSSLQGNHEQALQEFQKHKNSLQYYKTSGLPNASLILSQSQKAFKNGEISAAANLLNLKTANEIQENYLLALLQYNQGILTLEYLLGKN